MENKKNNIYKIVMLVIITIIITFMATSIGMYNYFINTDSGRIESLVKHIEISDETEILNEKIEVVKNKLEEKYIGELNLEDMTEMAIKGYVAGIEDNYTEYLTADEYEELMVSVSGDYVGIGIYMYQDSNTGDIVIIMPIEGSPAEEAGILPYDVIVSINGESCTEMDANEASAKIKGEEGTAVELEILRNGEIIKQLIERRTVILPDSRSEVIAEGVGYIELTTFDMGCSENISKYLTDFQNQGIKKVIIDLRGNTGGVVSEAISFAELFVEKGDIIMLSYNKEEKEKVIKSNSEKTVDMDIVLLVNEYSASATEIVSAALQENDAATIVGTKTYGKGVMQEVLPIFEGALKVSIEEFKTPKGNKINKEGITPDVVVEEDPTTLEDEQLQKAIELLK